MDNIKFSLFESGSYGVLMWEITLQKHPFADRLQNMTIDPQLREIRKELLLMNGIDEIFKVLIHSMLI